MANRLRVMHDEIESWVRARGRAEERSSLTVIALIVTNLTNSP